jgi:hypothetical protein
MVTAVAELTSNIDDIRETQREQIEKNLPASTLKKREAEGQMIGQAIKIAKMLRIIGLDNNNKELITITGTTKNTFYRSPNNEALALARQILIYARENAPQLEECGINQTQITEFAASVETYYTLIVKPMDTIGEKKLRTTNLQQLFSTQNAILYDKLDAFITLYKDSNPNFYEEYQTARNIIFQNEGKTPTQPEREIDIPAKQYLTLQDLGNGTYQVLTTPHPKPDDVIDIPVKKTLTLKNLGNGIFEITSEPKSILLRHLGDSKFEIIS